MGSPEKCQYHDDALYAVPLPPASAGEVETARIVGWAMCFVPFGHDDTAAKPKLIFDSKEHAEDVARRQTAFGIGEGARFVVRPITWAAERAAVTGGGLIKFDRRADDAVEEAMAPGCHEHVALWDAINAYSVACGGHPTRGGGARMDAVVRVETALRAALRREKGAP